MEIDANSSNNGIKQIAKVNDDLLIPDDERRSHLIAMNGYRWKERCLQLRYLLSTEETQWVDFQDARTDNPRQVAQYILSNYTPQCWKHWLRNQVWSWAKKKCVTLTESSKE
eukprot:2696936-Ditylum_brightwellii.AAC.1